jgi:dienelactone hydrolase
VILRRVLISVSALCLVAWVCAAAETPAPRTVDLTASDGTNLKATYFAASAPGPGVLLFHQCNQTRKNWDGLAERLAASGLNVLTVDYRGFGESGGARFDQMSPERRGEAMDRGWSGDIDIAYEYLVSQKGVTRGVIGAGGASCGVNQSVQLARRHPEVKSLVLLSGDTNRDGREFLRASKNLPLFVSVADDDAGGAATMSMEWMLGLSANPSDKFEHYSNGGHGTAMFAAHPELPGMIVDWFVITLVKTPGRAPVGTASGMPVAEADTLETIDEPGGASKVAQTLADRRQHDPKAVMFPEVIVNQLGYEHLANGDTKGAIEIFRLNVAAFPTSPNAYDSLADAYLADGQKDLARQFAEKAIATLSSDTADSKQSRDAIKASAEQKLKP